MTATQPIPSHAEGKRLAIVPALNEAGSIARVVRQLYESQPGIDVLVVDDGSVDGTARAVPEPARVVSLPFNQGIGGAMQTGYRYAARCGYDVAVQVDGDGQHPATEVGRLIEHLELSGADMVVGSRFGPGDGYEPLASRMAGILLLRGLVRLLTGKRVADCTSGFRAVNRKVIHAFAHWYPEDYPEPEVIVLLLRGGFRVEQVPVQMTPRTSGRTSIPFTHGLFYVLKVSFALFLDLMRHPWPPDKVTPP